MRAALERLTGGGAGAMAERSVDRDTAQKLAALGYIGAAAGGATRTAADGRPDPKAMIGVFNRLRGANAALQQGRVRDAEMTAREVLEREPKNAFATLILGNALLDEGRYADAIRTYQSYAGLVPTSSEAHHRIAVCYSRMGDVDRAIAEEDAALVLDARDADARMLRGGLLAARGRTDEAIVDLRAAAEIVPDSAPVRVGLARVLISAKRLDEADAELRRALELQPQNPDAHAAQAALLEARGDLAAAAAVFARALQLRPDADDVRLDYASTLEKLGRISEARTEYQRLATGRETPRAIRSEALRRSAGLSGPRAGRP
jgi:tetratricopeptide (TPR) repeat protein